MATNMALRHTQRRAELISNLVCGTDHPNRIAAIRSSEFRDIKRQQTQTQWDNGERIAGVHIARSRREGKSYSGLTDDEVKAILADERPNRQIAEDYSVSPQTIRSGQRTGDTTI